MIQCERHIFQQQRNGKTPLERLNDYLREDRIPWPIAVQQLEEYHEQSTGEITAISYLITYSS